MVFLCLMLLELVMSRLTITLDDDIHQALKETAARQGRTIGQIVEEGLLLRGIKPVLSARRLVAMARANAQLSEEEAQAIAIEETRSARE